MTMPVAFRCVALPVEPFAHLSALTDAQLLEHGIRRMTVDTRPGFPCRISLADAEVGETVLLLPYQHQPADSPYRSSGPIFVREQARRAAPDVGEVPEALRRRLLSVRAYDAAGMMLDADVVEGPALEPAITRLFGDPAVAYLHLHNARPGCFACRVDRA